MKQFSIAIDGPAGAGKSSIAKQIAMQLGCVYIDTGAMYRTVGYYCMRSGKDYTEEKIVNGLLDQIQLTLKTSEQGQRIFLNDEDVSDFIRNDEVAAAASKVATYGEVRKALVAMQQKMQQMQSVVMDGRDIGTVVMPDATLKIYLTASATERAKRRFKDYQEKGIHVEMATLIQEINERDYQDMNRSISPLKKAEDAIEIDTTFMSIEEITKQIIDLLKERL